MEVFLHSFLTPTLDGCKCSFPRAGRFIRVERWSGTLRIRGCVRGEPGPVWTCGEAIGPCPCPKSKPNFSLDQTVA